MANSVSRPRRVSGELGISTFIAVRLGHYVVKSIRICRILPHISKILKKNIYLNRNDWLIYVELQFIFSSLFVISFQRWQKNCYNYIILYWNNQSFRRKSYFVAFLHLKFESQYYLLFGFEISFGRPKKGKLSQSFSKWISFTRLFQCSWSKHFSCW